MMLAPLLNLFALSAGAAGATLLVLDLESKGVRPQPIGHDGFGDSSSETDADRQDNAVSSP